mmetsp:Transcript_19574/g.68045  ORF Transcript_19574/g.68045 Transcript_19574/m.68045 type:complete len:410 (-) Transcript_19574:818-2047(-)
MHEPLGLILKLGEVEAFGLPFQAHTSPQEFFEGDGTALVSIQQDEQCHDVGEVQLQGVEVGDDVFVLNSVLELFDGELVGAVFVQVQEDFVCRLQVQFLHSQLLLDDGVAVDGRHLQRRLDENARDHIQDSEEGYCNIDDEHEGKETWEVLQDGEEFVPRDAVAHRHEQRQQGTENAAEPFEYGTVLLGPARGIARAIVDDALREHHAEHVQHRDDNHACPHHRPHCGDHGLQQYTEAREKLHGSHHADHPHHADRPKHPQGCHLSEWHPCRGEQPVELLKHHDRHDESVEQVPATIRDAESAAVGRNSEHPLEEEDDKEHHLQHSDVLGLRVGVWRLVQAGSCILDLHSNENRVAYDQKQHEDLIPFTLYDAHKKRVFADVQPLCPRHRRRCRSPMTSNVVAYIFCAQ